MVLVRAMTSYYLLMNKQPTGTKQLHPLPVVQLADNRTQKLYDLGFQEIRSSSLNPRNSPSIQ